MHGVQGAMDRGDDVPAAPSHFSDFRTEIRVPGVTGTRIGVARYADGQKLLDTVPSIRHSVADGLLASQQYSAMA